MTGLVCGDAVLTEAELRDRIAAAGKAGVDLPGRAVPIRDKNRVDALVTALAVRAAGGLPLIGDDRWDPGYWAGLRDRVNAAAPAPGMAWGTFTSGSTGTPRVVVRTEESWAASFPGVERLTGLTADDVVYLPSPLVSSVTMFSVAHARALGATVVLPRTHTVSAQDLADATVLHGTPYALRDILESGAAHRLRVALIGGARLDPRLRERAEAAGIAVVSYYGAAELSFVAADPDGQGLRPFDGVEVRVDDGALWVRSGYFAGGYLGAVDGPFRRTADGWGTVGDLAEVDPLRLLGRSDGAILTAAATVVPEDVEAALLGIEGIADAVVFALPHERAGDLVAAVIEPAPGRRPPTAGELRARAGTLLTGTHRPRRWYWVDRLPRTAAGKPAREQIRLDAIEGRVARVV
ncbi:acyl-CoA synthetase (AMP-forming)/AMP-acid ligase II [Asanoa ferruginea]|uniref:Acyl-CoA synthetase (AMP-forming)/AMP-acid ligase II n=1 Tax=Asanoa ferruginea TaxID=53367 RepID=A0A3D9ZEI6_9ACTN|nr:fatty acid--CoA ligase family protein [Asanoa ferruginea]REF95279.1 acyl-CoA synthetase (AMP-forming)/AMP-acid ligase II [Asanoa ferruginea]GIF48368.1 AMP-dependent synthetase [Asanoa ferruginea]